MLQDTRGLWSAWLTLRKVCSHPLYRWRQSLRKVKSCAPGCLGLKLKPQLRLAPKTRLLPCSCPVPFTRLMTVGSFSTHTLFLLTHTFAYSFPLVPVSFMLPRRSLCALHRGRPEAPPGEADTSPSSLTLSPGGSWGVLFLSLFLDCTYLGLKRFYFSVPLPQLARPGTQQDSKNVNQVNERMQDCSSDPITFPWRLWFAISYFFLEHKRISEGLKWCTVAHVVLMCTLFLTLLIFCILLLLFVCESFSILDSKAILIYQYYHCRGYFSNTYSIIKKNLKFGHCK